MNETSFKILEESMKERKSTKPLEMKQDFREMRVLYTCGVEDNRLESCMFYASGKTGNCTFRDMEFCRKELGTS